MTDAPPFTPTKTRPARVRRPASGLSHGLSLRFEKSERGRVGDEERRVLIADGREHLLGQVEPPSVAAFPVALRKAFHCVALVFEERDDIRAAVEPPNRIDPLEAYSRNDPRARKDGDAL